MGRARSPGHVPWHPPNPPTEGRVRGASGGRAGAPLPLDTMVPSTQPGHERKRGGGHWWHCQGRAIFYVLNKNPKGWGWGETHDIIFAAMTQTWGTRSGNGGHRVS